MGTDPGMKSFQEAFVRNKKELEEEVEVAIGAFKQKIREREEQAERAAAAAAAAKEASAALVAAPGLAAATATAAADAAAAAASTTTPPAAGGATAASTTSTKSCVAGSDAGRPATLPRVAAGASGNGSGGTGRWTCCLRDVECFHVA